MSRFNNGLIKIKGIETDRFSIELSQDSHGRYRIEYTWGSREEVSEWIPDYVTASMFFDMKLQELEGH